MRDWKVRLTLCMHTPRQWRGKCGFWKTTQTTGTTILKWQPAFRLVKVVFVVVNRQHRVLNQTVVPVVSVVLKTKAQKIIDKSERLVETRYCLTGSRMGTTYPRASPPVTTALLSTALQAGRLLSSGWSRRGTTLQADPWEWMYVGGWCEGE